MANYATLKAAIQNVVKTNGNNEITGALLQQTLLAMVSSLGGGFLYMGIATPTTNPGTPDQNVFYIASEIGTYSNFGGLAVSDGEVAIFKYNGTWTKEVTGAATSAKLTQLGQGLEGLEDGKIIPDYTVSPGYINTAGNVVSSTTYYYTSAVPVKAGQTIYVTTAGYGLCVIAKMNDNNTYTPLVNANSGDANVPATYKYTANEDMNVAACFKHTAPGYLVALSWPIIDSMEQRMEQLEQKLWNFSFIGKGSSFSEVHQLDGVRRYGHYRVYLPVTDWDTTGVSEGQTIFQVASYDDSNIFTPVLNIAKGNSILPFYDFTVPITNRNLVIGGRAADGVKVGYYVEDISYLDVARRSDVLGLDFSPWLYDRAIQNGRIVGYTGLCISSVVQLKAGDKVTFLSGGDRYVNILSKTDANGNFISSLLSLPSGSTQTLRRAEYVMTEDAYVRLCYSYGIKGSYYEVNGLRAQISQLQDKFDKVIGGYVPVDYNVFAGAVGTNGAVNPSSTTYRYSSPILLKSGWSIAVESKGYNFTPISKTDATGTTPYTPIIVVSSGDTTTLHKYTYTNYSDADVYVVCSWRYEVGQFPIYYDDGFQKVAELSKKLGTNGIPTSIGLSATSYVSTARNYILKNEMVDGVDTLLYSKDCGETWASTPNAIGDIVFVHWFADGTCLIAGNNAVYTTKDGLTFTPSAILDENGNSFTPSYNAFYRLGNYDSPYYEVDGKEALIWNDYGISTGYVSRVWYTDDNGTTIKCICAANRTQDIHEVVINPRHFHRTFVDKDGVLWITSGDAGSECMLIRGTCSNGAWSFEILASGNEWKLGQFWIDGPYAYAVTDYTVGDRPTGIIRWPLSKIDDSTSFEYVVKIPNDPPLSSYFEDNAGTKIILPDGIGFKKLYMARDNYAFEQVDIIMSDNVAPMVLIGPNYKGECIVNGISGYDPSQPFKLNYHRYMLSDGLRGAGVLNFATPSKLNP